MASLQIQTQYGIFYGEVVGGNENFAIVSVNFADKWTTDYQLSWQSIARSLLSGVPIVV